MEVSYIYKYRTGYVCCDQVQRMVSEVLLLDFRISMYGMRVRVALAEKQIKYEYKEEDITKNNKSALLLEMNPIHKQIPVLIHNGKAISESLIAVEYIDEVWEGKTSLLPCDPYERAQARFWADFTNKLYLFGRKVTWSEEKEEQEAAKKELIEGLKTLEKEALGDNKPYFGGDNFGFLDVCFVGFCTWFYIYEKLGNFNMEDECPKLMEWVKRCMEKESVSKSIPEPIKLYQCILNMKNHLG